MRIVAVEEHFITPQMDALVVKSPRFQEQMSDGRMRSGNDIAASLLDLGARRLAAMDEAGIDMQVLSLTIPGAQAFPPETAVPLARDVNDRLHDAIKAHPTRFAGLATIPTPDPKAAVAELQRAVTALGMKGAMINGRTNEEYMDDRKYWPIFEAAEALDVAIYLHPCNPHPAVMQTYFDGYLEIADAAWGFGMETGTHFLRLVLSGLFDDFPRLKFILGHLGEGLPFWLPRLNVHARFAATRRGLKKSPQEYLTENLMVSTSGHFSNPSFLATMLTIGIDNILFAVDWPYESNVMGVDFLEQLPISPADKEKLAHGNAARILKV